MNKEEKQIEELAKDMCEYYYKGTCYQDKKPCDCKCDVFTDAQYLYSKGYRKASEVAREIFAEIEELLNEQTKIACETRDKHKETFEPNLSFLAMLDGRIYSLRVVEEHIIELKKKYESEGGE